MSKRYGAGPYGVNVYSAAFTADAEGTITGAYAEFADGDRLAGAIATVSGVFSAYAEARMTYGGRAGVVGEYSLYAEPKFSVQQLGEAYLFGYFSLYAQATAEKNITDAAIMVGDFSLSMDPFEGRFWNPESSFGNWVPEVPASDIWIKEADNASPWRH